MIFIESPLKMSYVIELEPYSDKKWWFASTSCENEFNKIGHTTNWVQLNHSFTKQTGTIRGMHFQIPPYGEIKLVRCISGAVYDVIIDLRKDSDTFLNYSGVLLSCINKKMIYILKGFAHGFQTLTDDCELIYHHSEFYTPNSEAGIKYNDPKINIEWPLQLQSISERDNSHSVIKENFKGI